VDSSHNVEVILDVMNKTLVNGVEIEDALQSVMKDYEKLFFEPTKLVYFSNESNL